MLSITATLMLTMTITVYVPRAGGINGGGLTAMGVAPHYGFAACGPRYPFGTIFEILESMAPWALPQVVVCADRGRAIGNHNLDLALVGGNVRRDLATARQWGKQRKLVTVYRCWNEYLRARHGAKMAGC